MKTFTLSISTYHKINNGVIICNQPNNSKQTISYVYSHDIPIHLFCKSSKSKTYKFKGNYNLQSFHKNKLLLMKSFNNSTQPEVYENDDPFWGLQTHHMGEGTSGK